MNQENILLKLLKITSKYQTVENKTYNQLKMNNSNKKMNKKNIKENFQDQVKALYKKSQDKILLKG